MHETRTIDGSSNNIENPNWGKAGEALLRNVPAAYEGLNGPSGSNRPNPKTISDIVCKQVDKSVENEQRLSDFMWVWGQFLDHELDLSPEDASEEFPIPVPGEAPIPFARSIWDRSTGTGINNPRQQVNVLSSFVDAGNVYGTNTARAAVLRAFDGTGKLKVGETDGAYHLLPKNPGGLTNAPNSSTKFFIAGDVRANEHVVLACMHTLFLREHNRLCDTLAKDLCFPKGDESKDKVSSYKRRGPVADREEQIYQRARRIVAGQMQAITYNEFLPALLGKHALRPYTGYNQDVNPTICNIFSTAAYRLGHSMLSPMIQRVGKSPIPFEETFFSGDGKKLSVPELIKRDGIACYLAGAATQRMQQIDTKAIDAIRVRLFQNENMPLIDLAALNIQRGRDHGLPDYNTCRVAYGLRRKEDFRDISSDPETQQRLKQAYDGNVNLVDPWIGGLAEDHYEDAAVGELIYHVLKDQFERSRDGDRFWYENDLCLSDHDREDIRKTTLAKVIARNTGVTGLQTNVFKVPEGGSRPKLSRSSGSTSVASTKKTAQKKSATRRTTKKKRR